MSNAPSFFAPNDVLVGQDVGGREAIPTRDDLERYRQGTGSIDLPDDPLPPLLFHSEVYRDLSWYLPNLIGNLHARQEWQGFAPMHLGEPVVSRTTVVERYRRRNRDYVVAEVLWTDRSGRWLQRSRTHQSFLADDPVVAEASPGDRPRSSGFDVPAGQETIPPTEATITPAMCQAFSGPGANYHTDAEMARAFGFPDIVVQGMWTVCRMADTLAAHFGERFLRGGRFDVRLVNVVWPGDVVRSSGWIRETVAEGSRRRCHLDVLGSKADGTPVLVGTASALT